MTLLGLSLIRGAFGLLVIPSKDCCCCCSLLLALSSGLFTLAPVPSGCTSDEPLVKLPVLLLLFRLAYVWPAERLIVNVRFEPIGLIRLTPVPLSCVELLPSSALLLSFFATVPLVPNDASDDVLPISSSSISSSSNSGSFIPSSGSIISLPFNVGKSIAGSGSSSGFCFATSSFNRLEMSSRFFVTVIVSNQSCSCLIGR
uniref:Putative secreted peptide n=1 Tax=Anopheles braziliensis TaxID=58242 RepID=A0A2M3ZPP2_9DIPT